MLPLLLLLLLLAQYPTASVGHTASLQHSQPTVSCPALTSFRFRDLCVCRALHACKGPACASAYDAQFLDFSGLHVRRAGYPATDGSANVCVPPLFQPDDATAVHSQPMPSLEECLRSDVGRAEPWRCDRKVIGESRRRHDVALHSRKRPWSHARARLHTTNGREGRAQPFRLRQQRLRLMQIFSLSTCLQEQDT